MSLFDIFSSSSAASDTDVGNQVLQAYFLEASKFPEFGFGDYDAWITSEQTKVSDIVELIGQLVKGNYASTTVDQAASRVQQLANSSGGQATPSDIIAAAGGKGDTINWSAAIPEVGAQTAKDTAAYVATTAQNIGQGVMATTSLVKYLPWILGIGAGLYIFTVAKTSGHSLGSAARTLSDAAAERIRRKK